MNGYGVEGGEGDHSHYIYITSWPDTSSEFVLDGGES